MQQQLGATPLGIEVPLAAAPENRGVSTERAGTRRGWVEVAVLALVYAVSAASLAGFATFSLHPEMLSRSHVSPETYGRILMIAPRAQILIAMAALVVFLVRRAGGRWVLPFAVVYAVSLGAELAGTTAGIPFGPYRYTDGLGIKWLGHVPALIPASWFMMALPSYAVATRCFPATRDIAWRIALGSFILLSWDLALDPAMSFTTKYWIWDTSGPYYGMPILNLVGWFVTGVALMATFVLLRAGRWIGALPLSWLLGFYLANLVLPVGMSIAARLWGAVAATSAALAVATVIALRVRVRDGVA
jgi:putative membrane protein